MEPVKEVVQITRTLGSRAGLWVIGNERRAAVKQGNRGDKPLQ